MPRGVGLGIGVGAAEIGYDERKIPSMKKRERRDVMIALCRIFHFARKQVGDSFRRSPSSSEWKGKRSKHDCRHAIYMLLMPGSGQGTRQASLKVTRTSPPTSLPFVC